MSNRKINSKNKRSMPKKRKNNKQTPLKSRNDHSKGRNKKGSRLKRRSNFSFWRFLLLVMITLVTTVAAKNDFDVEGTIEDFRGFNILEMFDWDRRPIVTFSNDFDVQVEDLAMLYPEGREVVYLDVMTIQAEDWEYERLDIGGHDHLGRTLPIIAFLSERNLGSAEERGSQTHLPTGWQQNQFEIAGTLVWVKNRGHLIAYTFTFNFNEAGQFADGYLGSENNPTNLFTQTTHANQFVMTRYEDQVRALLAEGCEVVYKAAPVFRNDELMARGIWLQAASNCDDLMLSVFIFNEQPGVVIDHGTGENWLEP